jgi:hypothetical protein
MSDAKEPEPREVTPDIFSVFFVMGLFLMFMLSATNTRKELRRIADALERAHPAPEAGK